MNYIVYDHQTKEIIRTGECSEYDFPLQPSEGQGVVEGSYTSQQAYVDNGVVIPYTQEQAQTKANKPSFFFVWSNDTFTWQDPRDVQQKYNDAVDSINIQRVELLYKSDWTQIPNNPLTTEKQQEWADYRQQLRDITSQSGYPFNVVWPTQPE